MPTLKDIANHIGVSQSLVSRVLSEDKTLSVSDETRKKIIDAAEELNYKRKKKSNRNSDVKKMSIGIITALGLTSELNDPYFLSIRIGAEERCNELGFDSTTIISSVVDKQENEFDGIIAINRFSEESIKNLENLSDSIVFVDAEPVKNDKYDVVLVDYRQATRLAINHFISQGISKIGFIGGKHIVQDDTKLVYPEDRHKSFLEYMDELKLLNLDWVRVGDFSVEDGKSLIDEMFDNGSVPDAIFVASDAMAFGAYRSIIEHGKRVGRDIKVVGFDDIPTAQYLSPSLTSVKVPTHEMGRNAVDLLLNRVQSRRTSAVNNIFKTKLIKRESS